MTVTVKHSKTNAISDWTQAQLDEQIALGNFAEGTVLADIVLPSDWNNDHTLTGVGTMAEQNANSVAITGGTINGTTIGATTPSTGKFTSVTTPSVTASSTNLNLYPTSTGNIYLNQSTTGAYGAVLAQDIGTSTSSARLFFATSAGTTSISNIGGDNITFRTAATIGVGSGSEQFRVINTNASVNYVQVTGAATTAAPTISAQGSDTNIALQVTSKSAGNINLGTGGGTQFRVAHTGSAVNILQATGSATGFAPILSTQPLTTDTNVSMALKTTGTGAIDLAAGSSGVNISNGGTVTAITRTSSGSLYTSIPSCTISAPTTAGGVQATVSLIMAAQSGTAVTPANGGTGYTLNDVLTVVGGTFAAVAQFTVTGVSAGVVTQVTRSNTNFGNYTVLPTSPAATTGGTGTGCTLNMLWEFLTVTITNAGSGYIEQPTVTFSGGGGSGASAYASVGGTTIVRGLGTNIDFYVPSSIASASPALRIADGGSSTIYPQINNFGSTVNILAAGATNTQLLLGSNGTSPITLSTNGTSRVEQLRVAHTASAVNFVQVTGGATLNPPVISAQGSDATVSLLFQAKGGATTRFWSSATTEQFRITHTASAVNYLQATGSAAGSAPVFSVAGTDTNIDLALTPKGTGKVNATNTTSSIVQSTGSSGYGSFLASSSTGNSAFYFGYVNNTEVGRISMTSSNNMSFATSSSALEQFRVSNTASAVNYVQVTGSATGGQPTISAQGSDTNVILNVASKNNSPILFFANGSEQFRAGQTATAVNSLVLAGATTGLGPSITSRGSDTNVNLNLATKGTGSLLFYTNNGANIQFQILDTASSVNYCTTRGSIAGSAPIIGVAGSDTNIDLTLTPKGTGVVQFGTHTANADTAISGYITIRDAGGTLRKLAVIT